jgi:transcriptional regulator with XRE-family HTH domain
MYLPPIDLINVIRAKTGWTQIRVAEVTGIDQGQLSRVERGVATDLGGRNYIALYQLYLKVTERKLAKPRAKAA